MSAATSSLSSVVSQLMRASMGASVSSTVKDEDLDRYVAELILKEAKQAEERYKGKEGIGAYLPHTGLPENNVPKANKRFLHSIIRNVDDHNTAILRAQAKAAEEVRLQREEAERADRRARALEASQERLRRLMGGGRRRSRERAREAETHRSVRSKRERSSTPNRDWVWDDRRNADDRNDHEHRSKRHRSGWRDDGSEAEGSISRSSHDHRYHRRDESRRYPEASSSSSTPPQTLRKERHRSSSPWDPSPSTSTASHKRPPQDNTTTIVEDVDSAANSRGPGTPSLDGKEQILRHSKHICRTSSSHELDDTHTPRSRTPSEDRHHSSRKEKMHRDASQPRGSDEREQSSHRRRSRRHHSPTESHRRGTSRSNDRHSPSRSRSPSEDRRRSHRSSRTHSSRSEKHKGGNPEDEPHDTESAIAPSGLSSKMDKYFDPMYDPKLDYEPAMDTNSFVQEGAFDGWDAMLQLMRLRREDKEDRKQREREGISPSANKRTGVDTESNLTDIVYKKRGSVREWDLGKEQAY